MTTSTRDKAEVAGRDKAIVTIGVLSKCHRIMRKSMVAVDKITTKIIKKRIEVIISTQVDKTMVLVEVAEAIAETNRWKAGMPKRTLTIRSHTDLITIRTCRCFRSSDLMEGKINNK